MQPAFDQSPAGTFSAELRRFKIDCGDPSLARIAQLSERFEPRLSKSAIGDVMNGKRVPGLDFTMALVRSLITHADSSPQVARDDPRLREWRTRWQDTKKHQDEIHRAARTHTAPPHRVHTAESRPRTAPETPTDGPSEAPTRPGRNELPVQRVQRLRSMLNKALAEEDSRGRRWADARYGCYAFFDYDGEPIYVGQANEGLRIRVRRHLVTQRTDAVAMGILDVQEVAEMELWPLWELSEHPERTERKTAAELLNRLERAVYLQAVEGSRFGTTLNERAPHSATPTPLPPSMRFALVDEQTRSEHGHADVRIARRAATIARISSLFLERGEVSDGARRSLTLQAARLTHLAASRLAYVQGRPDPGPGLIDAPRLLGDNQWTMRDTTRVPKGVADGQVRSHCGTDT